MTPVEISPEMSLFEITERYPETIPVFVENGFAHVGDPAKRESHGKMVTLAQAMRMKGKDPAAFRRLLEEAVTRERRTGDVTLDLAQDESRIFPDTGDIRVAGLLPCPVRIPLLEAFAAVREQVEREHGVTVGFRLAAASLGMDVVEREMARLRDEADLPHLFVSAGFEAFFDRRHLARFADAFTDTSWPALNPAFAGLDLKDPAGHFAMIAVVPAVFLVDRQQLAEDEPVPTTWAELLEPRFARRISLPVGDFDLFNGILLTLYKEFGEEGVAALSRNLLKSLHPSQAAGRFKASRGEVPAVSVVPYFFTRMAAVNPHVTVVWPEDGAVVSPVFMLQKRDAPAGTQALADFFLSRETGEILAHRGLFPSCHPEVDNPLPDGAGWRWLGWDFVREHDLGELIPRLQGLFRATAEV